MLVSKGYNLFITDEGVIQLMYPLNFGAFCSELESIQPQTLWKPYFDVNPNSVTQPDIVAAVMFLPYSDKDL